MIRYAAHPYQEFGLGRGKVVGLTKSPNASSELPRHVVSAIGIVVPSSEFYHRVTVLLDVKNGLYRQAFYCRCILRKVRGGYMHGQLNLFFGGFGNRLAVVSGWGGSG
ncbi:hypothetical protein D3C80_1536280 [compost metagenome]